ncbi:sensor histidine kinase [Propylenella binzhouense]|uniref:sensor histidine kinase n=1 Tax=Propylenella binzhouense TaxID=2555902 RepID=UPI00136E0E4B|nr:PAS domain-containing sensor histidine kinase [Propylenella binzhouense]
MEAPDSEAGLGSETLLAMLDVLPIAISVTVGPEHRFVYANRYYRERTLGGGGDPVGRTVADLSAMGVVAGDAPERDIVLRTSEPAFAREVMLEAPTTADRRYFDVAHIPLFEDGAAAGGVVTLGIDVTEKVLARRETELRALEASFRTAEAEVERRRLSLAIEATGIGIWEWEIQTNRKIWSERQCEIFGVPPGETPTYDIWVDRLHPDDRAAVLDRIRATLDPSSGGALAIEHRVRRPDGSVRWIQGSGQMLYDEAGIKPVRMIGTVLDVTERKETNEALRAALAAKEILLREVNHRVKNSLQLVSSMLALQGMGLSDPAQRKIFQEAQSRIQIVAAVHERLYSTVDTTTVELGAYLRELCSDIERANARAGIRIELAADPVRIGMDRAVPIALVLNELVTNALKYAYPSGEGVVRVVLAKDGAKAVTISVEDSGIGLPGDFESRRLSSLGFRIVEGLSRQLGGSVAYERLRQGTRFTVRLD